MSAESVDMSDSIVPRSDQQNFDDYLAGPRTVTVEKVTRGSAEQPIDIHLVEYPGRPYKPSKSMRRVLVHSWGPDASQYVGRRLRLYGDPDVKFGGQTVGGIKISHLSHIDRKMTISLTATRGKRAPHVVEPLPAGPQLISADVVADIEKRIAAATTLDDLSNIAADLKTWELGAFKQQLQSAWKDRQSAIKNTPAAADEPEPDASSEPGPASDEQLAKLRSLRSAQGYDGDDAGWYSLIGGIAKRVIKSDNDIADVDADAILAVFAEEDAK